MTPQQQRQFIREKCIEANDSIKDLVFGCEFYFDTDNKIGGKYIVTDIEERPNGDNYIHCWGYRDTDKGYFHVSDFTKNSNLKIIGRKIALADIMLVIGQDIAVVGNGVFVIWDIETRMWQNSKPVVTWNLLEDDLDFQSDEFVAFVYGLLTLA